MIPGIMPAIRKKSGASGYSFTMTAGSSFGIVGYVRSGNSYGFPGSIGSISGEPISGATLDAFASGSGFDRIKFVGTIPGDLGDTTVWVDGVEYAAGFSWTIGANAEGVWSSGKPPLSNGVTHDVEIK